MILKYFLLQKCFRVFFTCVVFYSISKTKASPQFEEQKLNGVCVSEVHGWGHYLPLENCHLFETEAFKHLRNNFYLKKAMYCCPDRASNNRQEDELMPRPPLCGTMLNTRIVGGTNTTIDEFPWMVRLKYIDKKGRKVFLCGGSLISSRWVLTAAHCVTGYALGGAHVIGVRLGEWNIQTNPDCEIDIRRQRDCAPPHVDVFVDRILPHQDFDKVRRFSDDIALLRLASILQFNDFVKPICLPLADGTRNADLVNMMPVAEVAGWGRSSHNVTQSLLKQKATLTLRPLSICQMTFDAWRLKLDVENQLCAGGATVGTDTCKGDSGGALMIETKNAAHLAYYYVAGIVSFGRNMCGRGGHPAVYTRVNAYVDWIVNKIRENS